MFKKINKTYLSIFLLLIISLIIYRRWISFNIFWAGDYPFYPSSTLKYFLTPSLWFNLNDLGSINLTIWRLPIDFLQGVFGFMGMGSNISEKFLIFWPTLIVANISSFLLVKKTSKSNLAGFIGAIVFNYNTYYFVINTAFLLYSAAAWSVLTLYIFILAMEKKRLYLFIIASLTLFISGSYDFRIAYISVFILGFYFIFHLIFNEKFNLRKFVKTFYYFILLGFILIFLNLYWVMSFAQAHSLTTNFVLLRGLFGNEFSNILYSITLFHPFWTGGHTAYFNPQRIFIYFWIIPILAFSGLFLNRKNKYVVFFGLISLLGIFLTKQVGHPFSNIYPWLYNLLPGFNAFREASKFYFLIALGYSVLLGNFSIKIFKITESSKYKLNLKYILIFLIVLIFLWNAKPIITGEIQEIYTPKFVAPQDYHTLKNFLEKQDVYSRTLWVPYGSIWSSSSSQHPIVSAVYILTNDWYPESKIFGHNVKTTGQYVTNFLKTNTANNLLDEGSVKYIIVPSIDLKNGEDVFAAYGESRQYYIEQISKIPYIHKIDIGTKDLDIYENFDYKPHVYVTKNKETIREKQGYKNIENKLITPSQYQFVIRDVKAPFYLNFSDSYNSGWKIRIGDFSWLDAVVKKNYFLSESYHSQNDATLNSFYIDPKQICEHYNCLRNADGSYSVNITLYFSPQSYLYLGLIICGTTLITIILYLLFILGLNTYGKRKN